MPCKIIPPEIRFMAKVDKNGPIPSYRPELGPCWIWLGAMQENGYGRFGVHRRVIVSAYRFSYELAKGKIPHGLHLDHLCRIRICVNPDHLEAVTQRENNLRGISPLALKAKKTHCVREHEFTKENTHITPLGRRSCRKCWNYNNKLSWQKVLRERVVQEK